VSRCLKDLYRARLSVPCLFTRGCRFHFSYMPSSPRHMLPPLCSTRHARRATAHCAICAGTAHALLHCAHCAHCRASTSLACAILGSRWLHKLPRAPPLRMRATRRHTRSGFCYPHSYMPSFAARVHGYAGLAAAPPSCHYRAPRTGTRNTRRTASRALRSAQHAHMISLASLPLAAHRPAATCSCCAAAAHAALYTMDGQQRALPRGSKHRAPFARTISTLAAARALR